MTIGIVTASLFGIAGTVQTAEVRREAGEHLFHRLLYKDMITAVGQSMAAD